VRDAAAVARAVDGHDAVIHTAYVQGDRSVTAGGTVAVAAACAAAGARLVHVSTDVVFDGRLGRPYREHDRPSPITDYGRSKLVAERAVAERSTDAAIVRTSLIYGGPGRAPSAQERQALDATMKFFTDEQRSPVQVADLAAALLELVDMDRVPGLLHIGGADGVSRHEFARLVVGARGGDPDSVESASFRDLGLDRPADCRLDCAKAEGLLRTRLRGVREVLESG
jgi:dTDP-4-dehydrorhamnose reductase